MKNPNKSGEVALREPKEILKEMGKLDEETAGIIKRIERIL
ncbi:MAG: hypothetical protein AABZ25_07685 [Nitrospirota bacterium]